MYQAFYRKWRPQVFSDVVGQTAVTDTLKAQIGSSRLSHAYLFAGTRGTGKTTCAKILAKAVNCENPQGGDPCNECPTCRGINDGSILDVVEIDAASNNGVDGVRELRDEAVYSPAAARKRVYIIDEVHMFSPGAFNALLKILEEPPAHVIFILATTELHKVPATILSRCQRFTFKRITMSEISRRLKFVAENENIKLTDEAADFIAHISDGGMRDALSIFDQCAAFSKGEVDVEVVEDAVGLAGSAALFEIVRAIARRDATTALESLTQVYNNGRDLVSVLNEISTCMRDILILKTAPDARVSRLSASYDEKAFSELASEFEAKQLIFGIDTISKTMATINHSANRRIDAELCVIKLCESSIEKDLYSLNERISRLEKNPVAVKVAEPEVKPKAQPAKKEAPESKPEPAKEKVEEKKPEQEKEKTEAPAKSQEESNEVWGKILDVAKNVMAPGMIPLLKSVQVQIRDNTIYLGVEDPFIADMFKERQYMEPLRECATQVLGGNVMIKTQQPKPEKEDTSKMDELCDSLKGLPNITII